MNRILLAGVSAAALFAASTALAAGDPAPATAVPAAKPYPLTTCIVSGEPLGDMGTPVSVIIDGQEYKLCCGSCARKLKADPAKFAKVLAEAVTVPAAASDTAAPACCK